MINAAIQSHSVGMVDWLVREVGAPQATVKIALSGLAEWEAELGRLGQLQEIQSRVGALPTAVCLCAAIKSGQVDVAKWLYSPEAAENVDRCRLHEVMQVAAARQFWEVVKWTLVHFALSDGKEDHCFSRLNTKAASQGNLEMAKYLHERWPSPRSTEGTYHAARGGHFGVVRWLNKKLIRGGGGIDGAARSGHMDIIE